jgi:NAD(P)-dependent dehydrogenase (short-subunit alcohol dehydrogenase family)
MFDLKDKVAVVLGASAEGGTGWAIAEALAREGAKVVVGARTLAPLQVLADRIGGLAVQCDAGDEAQVANLAEEAVKKYGRVDVAVNSAGLPIMGMIADVTQKKLDDAIRVNYYGHVYFIKHMTRAIGSNGSIIIISSISSTQPDGWFFAYACAKAATNCLVAYAAREYGHRNIRINAILPGPIESNLAAGAWQNPQMRGAFEREIPLGRIGQVEDFAYGVLFLAGPAYCTGLALQLNGGFHLGRFPFHDELPGGTAAFGEGLPLAEREARTK